MCIRDSSGYGLEIVERVSTLDGANPENMAYLRTKQLRMGHLIDGLEDVAID